MDTSAKEDMIVSTFQIYTRWCGGILLNGEKFSCTAGVKFVKKVPWIE